MYVPHIHVIHYTFYNDPRSCRTFGSGKKKKGVIRLVPKPVYSKYVPNVPMY